MLLEVDNVELYFKDKRVLHGIYLKAEAERVTGVLGRNGAGKSSLLEIIFGSLKPKYKLVRLNGIPLSKAMYRSKKVRYLPQYNYLPNSFKVNKTFKLYEVDWQEFVRDFNDFKGMSHYKPKMFSSGQRRLIETYLILRSTCEIVLLDEPFSQLSPLYIQRIKELILREKFYKTIVLTDHMYEHVIDTADDIYLLRNGCTKLIDGIIELEDNNYLSESSLA